MLPDREERDRPGSVPGPPLRRLVPAHHPGHARARLPGRHGGDRPKSPGSGLISLTLGEIRRLLAHLITKVPGRAAIWAWSRWRRQHQQRAKTSHYQRRHAQHNEVCWSISGRWPGRSGGSGDPVAAMRTSPYRGGCTKRTRTARPWRVAAAWRCHAENRASRSLSLATSWLSDSRLAWPAGGRSPDAGRLWPRSA
jgi:hypothetical protein